ncbi:hypothetical protein JXC34_02125 [Candidatus Woesearchaeota archaeon]|nr:hypothetical protein [Candidatus Woesearchaeota archaeon]
MDSFHTYLKKQLLDYVESERDKGVALEQIEQVLLNAGHQKNIVDEVFDELKKEQAGKKTSHSDPVENDLVGQLKSAFQQFMAKASQKEVKEAKKDMTESEEVVKEVIEEAEVIEENRMFESMTFFAYLIMLAVVILFTAGSTDSNIVNVAIGFAPAVLSIFISFLAVSIADNVPLYVFIPLIISSAFYALGRFAGLGIFKGLDIEALAIVNFLFAFIFNILVVYVRFLKPRSMMRKALKRNIQPTLYNENSVDIKTFSEEHNTTASHHTQHHTEKKEIQELKREFRI